MDSELVGSIMLCDGVIEEKGSGKMTLIGCFNALGSPQIPFMHPGITAFIQITNFRTGAIDCDVTIRLEDKTGHVLASAVGHVKAEYLNPETIKDVSTTTLDVPLRLPPVVFQRPGTYGVKALVNNEELHTKWLPVFHVPQPSQNPQ